MTLLSIQNVRDWLSANKIFLEVFSIVVVGVTGVIVSRSAVSVARHQALIAEAEVTPHLRADVDLERELLTGKYTEDVLRMYNDGFRIRDVDTTAVVFLEVEKVGSSSSDMRYLWLAYYTASFATGASTGLLETLRGYNNHSHAVRIEDEVRLSKEAGAISLIRVQVVRVVFPSYTDALGRRHDDTILVHPVGGGRVLSDSEAGSWRELYESVRRSSHPRELNTINGAELIKVFDDLPRRPAT